MRELERLSVRKTLEVEVLKEALEAAQKKGRLAVAAATGQFPVKLLADTLGVARSNLIEQLQGRPMRCGNYRHQGDDKLLATIRQLTDAQPNYGFRRIEALLNWGRRAAGTELSMRAA